MMTLMNGIQKWTGPLSKKGNDLTSVLSEWERVVWSDGYGVGGNSGDGDNDNTDDINMEAIILSRLEHQNK